MSLFPDGRVCQRCGGPMEVHVDLHCQRCGWKPGESTVTSRDPVVLYGGRYVSARDAMMLEALGEAGRIDEEEEAELLRKYQAEGGNPAERTTTMASTEERFEKRLAASLVEEINRQVAEQTKATKQKAKTAHEGRQAAEIAKKEALATLEQKKLECQDLASQLARSREELQTIRVTCTALQKALTDKENEGKKK